jgi:hypothetical protein
MPEINKSSLEVQNEINSLIPYFIENLGNPKVSNCLILTFIIAFGEKVNP